MQQLVARQILQESSEPDQVYIPPDLLNELGDIAARHNPNREWYFTVLDESESITVVRLYLENMIHTDEDILDQWEGIEAQHLPDTGVTLGGLSILAELRQQFLHHSIQIE